MSTVTETNAIFLYEPIVHEVISPRSAKTMLLSGGTSTGKTTVLERLCEEFRGIAEPTLIAAPPATANEEERAAHKNAAISAMERAFAEDRPLLIDDLDRFFDRDVAEALRRAEAVSRKQKTILTSTLPPDVASLHSGDTFAGVKWDQPTFTAWSEVTMSFTTRSVDPWTAGWHRRLVDYVVRVTGETSASGWSTVVLHVTGGHPALLSAALEALEIEKVKRGVENLAETDVPAAEWQRRVLQLEDDIFPSGFRRLRRGIRDLQERNAGTVEALRTLSRDSAEDLKNQSTAAKRSLLVSGLAYRTVAQPFVIAGEMLRRYLAEDSETRQPSIDAVGSDSERGELVITIGNERRTVPLRAASWRLLKTLRDAKSDFVTLQTLEKKTGVETAAVRSILQRLKSEIQRGGYEEIVENVWGAGYRLGTFPLTVPVGTTD
ncbi:MAG TPA: hypothetical protein VHW00_11815 [Thermoanaerobaculia bacterium]|nr:hypothetical protein [Thermoanaerobaculia bacterium]